MAALSPTAPTRPTDPTMTWRLRASTNFQLWNCPGATGGRNTAWGAMNAIAKWSEWSKPKDPTARGKAESAITGDIAAVRQRAWNIFAPAAYVQLRGGRPVVGISADS